MYHDISAVAYRAQQHGCGHSRIDNQRDLMAVGKLGDRFDVEDVQRRIAGHLAKEEASVSVDSRLPLAQVG